MRGRKPVATQIVTHNQAMTCYQLFGVTLRSDFPFTYPLPPSHSRPDVTFTCLSEAPLSLDWATMQPLTAHEHKRPRRRLALQLYAVADCLIVRVATVGDFYIWPHQILCHPCVPINVYEIELYLLGSILTLWQERHNRVVLHASAVVVDQQAIAFVARSGSGKSGLAVMFLAAGHALLTDDTLALQIPNDANANHIVGQPGYPQMRMWPEQADQFLGHHEHLPTLLPDVSKRRVPIGTDGFGTFCPHSTPIAAIYLPRRRSPEKYGKTIGILPLSQSQAIFHLMAHCFAMPYLNRVVDQQQRLRNLLPVVQRIPIYHLHYPSGFAYLPTVQQAILASLKNQHQHEQPYGQRHHSNLSTCTLGGAGD